MSLFSVRSARYDVVICSNRYATASRKTSSTGRSSWSTSIKESRHGADPPILDWRLEGVLKGDGALLLGGLAFAVVSDSGCGGMADHKPQENTLRGSVPPGFFLHAYDDCGVPERQPHVLMQDSYVWTFQTSDTEADLKSRSAVFSYKAVRLRYDDLDPGVSYALVLTYASDHVYNRVQSLWADGLELHGPIALPKARSTRVVVKVPAEVTRDGKMALELRIHGQVNATMSIAELWASTPPAGNTLRLEGVSGVIGDLTGRLLDLAYDPVAGATVRLFRPDSVEPLATAITGPDGSFKVTRERFDEVAAHGLSLVAEKSGHSLTQVIPANELPFAPVRYWPVPASVAGLPAHQHVQSLDGTWRIDPAGGEGARARPLSASGWKDLHVPGQWRQQGFDLPRDRSVAVAKEFTVPASWAGRSIILCLDAIHSGTRYWLNNQLLGQSENLFTPVQWDVTTLCHPGGHDRLDLEMKVDTPSERLSVSSDYAFHNLGGIDRSVRIVALPDVHVRSLQIRPALDPSYRDGRVDVEVTLKNSRDRPVSQVFLRLSLQEPDNMAVPPVARRQIALVPMPPGDSHASITLPISNPRKWSAEKPELYRLVLELLERDETLERIERLVGFRTIEVRGSQVWLNGVPIKLAGACRHEVDPLTGRADTMKHGETDVKLFKAANLNFLRTSHYPPTIEMVEAADRLGMYLEVEAPLCWVDEAHDMTSLREVLIPTSAMIDYYHSHPSVIFWSLANESNFNRCFEVSNQLVKQLDPTRPTDFNNPDPKQICDIANLHYPPMPYDEQARGDPRPLVLRRVLLPGVPRADRRAGQPGLREYFGAGHSDPASPWGRECALAFAQPYLKPGTPPGAWTHIVGSTRVTGGAIFAALDDAFYFADGQHAGYAWHHGFWGIIDAWRRPKPEWWLAKMVFSPAWFPVRQVKFHSGASAIDVPVENRYAFTNLDELEFTWRLSDHAGGSIALAAAPGGKGMLKIPIPAGTREGTQLEIHARDRHNELVSAAVIQLGPRELVELPRPDAGRLNVQEDGSKVVLTGNSFSLVLDRMTGDFVALDPRHRFPLLHFPVPHLTRYDFGDLAGPHGRPYAVFPDDRTRRATKVEILSHADSTEIVVEARFDVFAGTTRWRMDKEGKGLIHSEQVYTGEEIDSREAGIRLTLDQPYQALQWRRWAEWGVYPEDSISRPEGHAQAFRPGTSGPDREGVRPTWPWSLDQTELGTADFRSVKLHIDEASLNAPDGSSVRVLANADRHVRACLAGKAVSMHVLSRCGTFSLTEVRNAQGFQGGPDWPCYRQPRMIDTPSTPAPEISEAYRAVYSSRCSRYFKGFLLLLIASTNACESG